MIEILFFHAPWCGQCKAMSPTIDYFRDNYEVKDIDISKDLKSCDYYKVKTLPTTLVCNGDNVIRLTGIVMKSVIDNAINEVSKAV